MMVFDGGAFSAFGAFSSLRAAAVALCVAAARRMPALAFLFASVRRIPGFPVAIVDTIGSGDAHTGGVIAGLMCGLPIDECVLLANRVASVVTGREGGACAPTIDELLTEHC